jgi:hypothetical protein
VGFQIDPRSFWETTNVMATLTHYLIFDRESAFDLEAAFALLSAVEVEISGGAKRKPDRVTVRGDEARVDFGPEHLRVSVAPLPEAVALLHRVIGLHDFTEADPFVANPGFALRLSADLEDGRMYLFWCLNPETENLEYEGDEQPVYLRDPDLEMCFALVNHFPPAVFLMGNGSDEAVLCFPSATDIRDWD